jgi:hypothetical protein
MVKMTREEALAMYAIPDGWTETGWGKYLVERGKNVDEQHGVIGKSMLEAGTAILDGAPGPAVPRVHGPERR